MVLFDSLLAFALTLAALATVVTLLMEFLIRVCGAKRKGQVRLFRALLATETVQKLLPEVGESAVKAVESAAKAAKPWWEKLQWDVIKASLRNVRSGAGGSEEAEAPYWKAIKGILENPLSSKKMADSESKQHFLGGAARGVYREVSLEHVLRRLLETEAAQDLVKTTKTELEPKLHAIGRKYDELSSALGADFKRRAQLWSVLVGVALAVVMNADGTRLLQTYLQDPDLRKIVIEKLSPAEDGAGAENGAETEDGAKKEETSGSGDPEDTVKKLGQQLSLINELALPMGNGYFPHCFFFQNAEERKVAVDPLCRTDTSLGRFRVWVTWLLKVLFTGVLIGLGAPFWYDVARRLAEVRTAFNGTPSGEERHRGTDGTGSQDQRDELIERIAADVAIPPAKKAEGNGGPVSGPNGARA